MEHTVHTDSIFTLTEINTESMIDICDIRYSAAESSSWIYDITAHTIQVDLSINTSVSIKVCRSRSLYANIGIIRKDPLSCYVRRSTAWISVCEADKMMRWCSSDVCYENVSIWLYYNSIMK